MTTRRFRSTAPLSSARVIDFGLPFDLLDLALSAPSSGPAGAAAVVVLRPENGPPAAVLKLARARLAAVELRAQRRVLAELAVHRELDQEWRELLPRILAFDERHDETVSIESYRPGIDLADALARNPSGVDELMAVALSAIGPLHRRTATPPVAGNIGFLRRWVVEPLTQLKDMSRRLDPRLVPEVDRLGMMLRQAIVGLRLPACWTHGDYTPGNVRMSGVNGPVIGIVDWGGARPGQPALIDEYLMILTVRCQVQQADLGIVVAERLRAGGLSDTERSALRAARGRPDAVIADRGHIDEAIDERLAILLTWLHRVADLWRRSTTPPNHHAWWATNVAPVLAAVREGFDVSVARGGRGGAGGSAPMSGVPAAAGGAPSAGRGSSTTVGRLRSPRVGGGPNSTA